MLWILPWGEGGTKSSRATLLPKEAATWTIIEKLYVKQPFYKYAFWKIVILCKCKDEWCQTKNTRK